MKYLTNGLSIGMLSKLKEGSIEFRWISAEEAKDLARNAKSIIGHEATAKACEMQIGIPVSTNRENVQLEKGDELIIYQLIDRPPEGIVLSLEQLAERKAARVYIKIC
jgi:hypothetical protein